MQAAYARQYRTLWERHWWWRSREAHVLRNVERVCRGADPRDTRILDVGCGDGLFFDALGRFGSVEGIEPDGSIVNDPRHRDRIRVTPLEEGLPRRPAYDLVLMLDVLEHIDDDLGTLRAVRDSLRPGGRLLLTVPALNALWSRHDEANGHARRYRRDGLARRLRAAGFAVESCRYFFAWTVLPMVARRRLFPAGESSSVGADYAVRIPPAPLNRALGWFSRCEHMVGRAVPWPLGSSLLAVGRVGA